MRYWNRADIYLDGELLFDSGEQGPPVIMQNAEPFPAAQVIEIDLRRGRSVQRIDVAPNTATTLRAAVDRVAAERSVAAFPIEIDAFLPPGMVSILWSDGARTLVQVNSCGR